MDFIITLIVGGLIGYVASLFTNTDNELGIVGNVIAGIVGAFFARLVFAAIIPSAASAGEFSIAGLFWGVLGAVAVIAIARAIGVYFRR